MKNIRNLYFSQRFFGGLLALVVLLVIAFIFPPLLLLGKILILFYFLLVLFDGLFLFNKKANVTISRNYPGKLSNGDENEFKIALESSFPFPIKVEILEELPIQFQYRDFKYTVSLLPQRPKMISFRLRPTERGVYHFGKCNVLIQYLGFVKRRIQLAETCDLPCYPSFIQLRKYSLLATTNRLSEAGIKKIRRIGNTLEFERIKEYVPGDDYRFINWKATAKIKRVMVNQYEDEKSQPIYSLIDLGRNMRMPFQQLTLLDYAINSSLVLSNIAILKQDRAGILTFSQKTETHIAAQKRNHQMSLISEALYHVKTNFLESEFGNLYAYVKRNINQRSLLFLYTNFETMDAMRRQLPYLHLLNKSHIVVVVIFKNTELYQLAGKSVKKVKEIYNQIIAEKLIYEKQLIVQKLRQNGLQVILTEPENLTVNSINKYLEIKARGLI